MGEFFIYILKSSVCLTFFFLFFRLLLSKETFHRFNRIALLGVLCLSWLIPWIEVTTQQQVEVNQAVLTIEQLLMMAENIPVTNIETNAQEVVNISWIQLILLVYLAGFLFFACRNLYSLVSLIKLLLSAKWEKMEKGVRLIVHEKEVAPFSWMKFIVINRRDLVENGQEILIHELAHIRNRHSIDLLIADICIFFQWFNPGAWLLKQELKNIHEYEADETVINEGVNAKEYQLLLIRKAVGTRLYSMANSFNHSTLKKRITMMLKEKSNPWARLKYLYVLPLAAVTLTAFARPEVSETVEEISVVKVNDLAAIVETRNEENVVKVPIDTATHFSIKGTRGKIIHVSDSVTKTTVVGTRGNVNDKSLVMINGMESDHAVINALNPERIESISVLEAPAAMKTYGEKGKNGALIIQLWPDNTVIENESKRKINGNIKARQEVLSGKRSTRDIGGGFTIGTSDNIPNDKEPLVIVDGKEVSGEKPLSKISPDRIKSVSVLKEKGASSLYGEKGKYGVILVETYTEEEYQARKNNPKEQNNNVLEVAMSKVWDGKEPIKTENLMFIIDGKEVSSSVAEKFLMKDASGLEIFDDNSKGKRVVRVDSKND